MSLIAYLDESGTPSLQNINPQFPIFCLTLALVDGVTYAQRIVPAFTEFKIKYFGHDATVLHSHEIRKSSGAFNILLNPKTRAAFFADLAALMAMPHYELIAVAIDKARHVARYANPLDPYDLALEFALERLCEWATLRGETEVHVVAEARNKTQDNALAAKYLEVVSTGTTFVRSAKFKALNMPFRAERKEANLIGHQLADLAAYAIARYAADTATKYGPWHVVKDRIFDGRRGKRYGLKLFP